MSRKVVLLGPLPLLPERGVGSHRIRVAGVAEGIAKGSGRSVPGLDLGGEWPRLEGAVGLWLWTLPLRRRSPVGKLLLGSNAQRVLLDAGCPVLAVKAAPDP